LSYICPFISCAASEWFRDNSFHSAIVYDDLTKHAVSFRQVTLLLGYAPGREAYPGDVFYLHSRLLERSGKLNEEYGNGSLTALPIIETQGNDISGYIPTNVISITDGQIFLETDIFYSGIKPAINIGLSVSRVGRAAQSAIMGAISGPFKLIWSRFKAVEILQSFSDDLDDLTLSTIDRGLRLIEILKQDVHKVNYLNQQVLLILSLLSGVLDPIKVE